uniref:(northern house mosquito) hypothetical protein n=1 Tax=Culex pipiens TaxID=7175 RepID=A0A8D8A6Q7_CULPI
MDAFFLSVTVHSLTCPQLFVVVFNLLFLLVFFVCFVLFSAFTGRIQVSYSRFGGLLFSILFVFFLFFFYFLCCLLRLFLASPSGERAHIRANTLNEIVGGRFV